MKADSRRAVWHKYPCESGGCIEVAKAGARILIRGSGNPGTVLDCSRQEWDAFIRGVRAGDLPLE